MAWCCAGWVSSHGRNPNPQTPMALTTPALTLVLVPWPLTPMATHLFVRSLGLHVPPEPQEAGTYTFGFGL